MKYPLVAARTVLVTGCSSGIGLAAARLLRDRGWQVLPTARKAADLAMLEADGFTPIELEIGDDGSVARAAERALEICDGALGALVNNAGFAQPGALEDVTRDQLRRQFEVNVFGMQDLTNRLIPALRRQGRGRIVNVSSVYGQVTSPMLGCYCATKHAMESLSDALRLELRDDGVAVSLVEPGPIVTAFRRNAAVCAAATLDARGSRFGAAYRKEIDKRERREKKVGFINRPPEDVAARIRHALESARPRRRYLITLPAYAGALGRRFFPWWLIDFLMAKQLPPSDRARSDRA